MRRRVSKHGRPAGCQLSFSVFSLNSQESLPKCQVYTKTRASFSQRRPVFDAIASKFSISRCPIMPALQLRRFSFDSISPLPARFRVCFGKVLPFGTRPSESAPSGAWVEGLIQAARCRTRCLTELLAPASGGLYSPGGLFSPNMSYLHI